jgi:hypothetical protein
MYLNAKLQHPEGFIKCMKGRTLLLSCEVLVRQSRLIDTARPCHLVAAGVAVRGRIQCLRRLYRPCVLTFPHGGPEDTEAA